MSIIVNLILFLTCGLYFTPTNGQFEGDSCVRKYDNSPGICSNVRNCPKVREEYKVGVPLTICAYLGGQPVVCCPQSGGSQNPSWNSNNFNVGSTNNQKRISVQKCEEYAKETKDTVFVNPLVLGSSNQHSVALSRCDSTTPLIVGGVKTKNGEYPHMVAIGWTSLDKTLDFKCGGSLISNQYVLTAAHCARSDGNSPSLVRLGDQNLRTRNDGLTEVDIPIAEFIKHESYRKSSYYNDIALIKMSRTVEFTRFIRPACLWQTPNINSSKTIATGWGYIEALSGQISEELMKVELDIINNRDCNSLLEDAKIDNGIVDNQICAGVLAGGKDTCNGDSGGPIQITFPDNQCLYHIIGLTSFGSPFCGQKNSPGVYTRISSYLDWIEEKVWS